MRADDQRWLARKIALVSLTVVLVIVLLKEALTKDVVRFNVGDWTIVATIFSGSSKLSLNESVSDVVGQGTPVVDTKDESDLTNKPSGDVGYDKNDVEENFFDGTADHKVDEYKDVENGEKIEDSYEFVDTSEEEEKIILTSEEEEKILLNELKDASLWESLKDDATEDEAEENEVEAGDFGFVEQATPYDDQDETWVEEETFEPPIALDKSTEDKSAEYKAIHADFDKLMASHSSDATLCKDWDDLELERRFTSECSYYLKDIAEWQNQATTAATVHAWQQQSGASDRFAGLVSAFHHASQTKQKIKIHWDDLDAVFRPSCYMKNILSFSKSPQRSPMLKQCITHSCTAALHEHSVCPKGKDTHLMDKLKHIRACITEKRCKDIKRWNRAPVTLAHSVGCPLRLMLEPRTEFLDHQVRYFMDGKVHQSSLRALAKLVKQFKTIALHYRAGDKVLVEHQGGLGVNYGLEDAKACMHRVDKFVRLKYETDKPVRWIVASDDERVRVYMRKKFPDKVIMLMAPPEHIFLSNVKDHRKSTINVFADWYLLTRADELVASKVKWAPVSGFSKFAMLYGLKYTYFSLSHGYWGKCVRMEVEGKGNIQLTHAQTCRREVKIDTWSG